MNNIIIKLFVVLISLASNAYAQEYIIIQPGKLNSYVDKNPAGGYIIRSPGEVNKYIDPNPSGGYIIRDPGNNQPNTYIQPSPGNEYYRGWDGITR